MICCGCTVSVAPQLVQHPCVIAPHTIASHILLTKRQPSPANMSLCLC